MRSQARAPSQATGVSAKPVLKAPVNSKKQSTKKPGNKKTTKSKPVIGWREWVTLPEFGAPPIKAKIDTGARTSALHAFKIRPFKKNGVPHIEFYIHPEQHRRLPEIKCIAPVLEQRRITSSTGHSEIRYVIETTAIIGGRKLNIELTLTNRDELGFRMLIGREAIRKKFIVDPGRSYCASPAKQKSKL